MWDDVRQGQHLGGLLVARHLRRAEGRRRRCSTSSPRRASSPGRRAWCCARTPRTTTTRTSSPTPGRASRSAQRLVSTWGYGHANIDVDLVEIDPDVVEVFGLDDPETALSSGIFDRYQPQRDRVQPGLGRGQGRRGLAGRDPLAWPPTSTTTPRRRRRAPSRHGQWRATSGLLADAHDLGDRVLRRARRDGRALQRRRVSRCSATTTTSRSSTGGLPVERHVHGRSDRSAAACSGSRCGCRSSSRSRRCCSPTRSPTCWR